jgi:hypothetical protein
MSETWPRERIRQVHLDFHIPEFPREALSAWNADNWLENWSVRTSMLLLCLLSATSVTPIMIRK